MRGGFNAHFDGLTELFRRRASSLESMLGSSAAKASFLSKRIFDGVECAYVRCGSLSAG